MILHKEEYGKDYFEFGERKGISCYNHYRWLPERTLITASEITRRAHIGRTDRILDWGCAKGYLVKALHQLGYKAYGTDTSHYAIKNSDSDVKNYLFNTDKRTFSKKEFDIVICKDTAEHIPYDKIDDFLKKICFVTKKKAIFIVPLGNGKIYNIPRYEKDITHKIRETLGWWVKKIEDNGFEVVVVTDDLKDIKPNWNAELGNLYVEAIPK